MAVTDQLEADHRARSDFIRGLVQSTDAVDTAPELFLVGTPRTIVQFWDRLDRLPSDVSECIESWRRLDGQEFEHRLFDAGGAREYIATVFGPRHAAAFDRCYHPAMQADYFRLCFVLREGGCYVDADDVVRSPDVSILFDDGRLKVQPLCYDPTTNQMVPLRDFIAPQADDPGWIYYFNNNPMCAAAGHPVVERALETATAALREAATDELPEIQSTTGPGNFTRAVFELGRADATLAESLLVLYNWETIATSKWPLSYRRDARNWRLSNRRLYEPPSIYQRKKHEPLPSP